MDQRREEEEEYSHQQQQHHQQQTTMNNNDNNSLDTDDTDEDDEMVDVNTTNNNQTTIPNKNYHHHQQQQDEEEEEQVGNNNNNYNNNNNTQEEDEEEEEEDDDDDENVEMKRRIQQNNNQQQDETKIDLKKQEELEEAAQYYEPLDLSRDGIYHVKTFDENTEKLRWKTNIKQMGIKEYSPIFTAAGSPWRILIFPKGNNVPYISLYLDTAGSTEHKFVRFQLSILNQKDIRMSFSQDAEKRFNGHDSDWGFREFLEVKRLFNLNEGFIGNDGTIIFEIVIHNCTEPYLVNPTEYDSRKETGFVGLQNQGATCYMNSLLQTLYLLTYFRKAVYKMPIDENEKPVDSIPLALMRVFYRLQFDKGAVDTKELTKSFGWTTIDSFLQHDVQELARVLTDNLEKKMEKTPQKDVMKQLFEGSCKNYVKCLNVQYESSRKETFYDLQLNVKGCKNVYDSFEQYISEETLQGDNQYHAEGFGMQDAKKGTIFLKFPPVLMLHLKRFEYDFVRDLMYKINDKYEFYNEINLTKYLSDESEQKNEDNTYVLFSVLVHSGDVSGGHYYNFAKPFLNDNNKQKWYKFDDEKVYEVDERLAIQDNFGGEIKKSKRFWLQPNANSVYKKFTNAYMLLYIRKSQLHEMIKEVELSDIPSHLEERFRKDREEKERKKKEKQEAFKYCYIKICTNNDLKRHDGGDLIEDVEPIRFLKDATLGDLKRYFEEFILSKDSNGKSYGPERQRFWRFEKRKNGTLRPAVPLKESDDLISIEKKFTIKQSTINISPNNLNNGGNNNNTASGNGGINNNTSGGNVGDAGNGGGGSITANVVADVLLYLEVAEEPFEKINNEQEQQQLVKWFPTNMNHYALLFIKEYNPYKKRLDFIGTIYANLNDNISDLLPSLKKLMKVKEDDNNNIQLKIYEELKPKIVELLSLNQSIGNEAELQSGDILTVHLELTEDEMKELEYPTAKDYYDYLGQRVMVEIRKLEEPSNVITEVELLKNMDYKQVTEVLGDVLKVNSNYIRLTGHHPYNEGPLDGPFRTTQVSNLKEMITIGQYSTPTHILYFEILDEPIEDVENKKEIIITFVNSKTQECDKFKFLLYPEQTVKELRDLIESKIQREFENSQIILCGVNSHKIQRIINDDEFIKQLSMKENIIASEMKQEEYAILTATPEIQMNYRTTQVQHICKEPNGYRGFGCPFILIIQKDETFGDIKRRIQEKLQVKDNDFKRYKFVFVSGFRIKDYLNETDENANFIELFDKERINNSQDVYVAMEHKDPTPRNSRWYEKPIVIKN
ncbi:hypothetical protein ABK040_007965 [Willaertia magna]